MKKIILIAILFVGCNSPKEFLNSNLKNISVYKYIYNKNGVYVSSIPVSRISVIDNIDSINIILSSLNNRKPEFRVFQPEYNIELNYTDTTIEIGVSQEYVKIQGRSFKVNKCLSKYLSAER
jgi:hypothetical protein